MKVTRIDVEGTVGKATVLRSETGEVVINIHAPQNASWVVDHEEQRRGLWPMARKVQCALDGCYGTEGDVADYHRIIQMLAD